MQNNSPRKSQKKRAKLSNKERAELESIPTRIEEIEVERAELSAKLEDSEYVVANFDKLEAINKRLVELNAEDEYLMQRWEELDARANM